MEDLGLAECLELFRAAHFWQLKGLSRCLCQRLPRLAQGHMEEALALAQQLDCPELWAALAPLAAKGPELRPFGAPFDALVREERRRWRQRQCGELRLRLANVPAARPGIVHWRQRMTEQQRHSLVLQGLEASEALVKGLKEHAPQLWRALSSKMWEELEEKEAFNKMAEAEELSLQESRSHLQQELEQLQQELQEI